MFSDTPSIIADSLSKTYLLYDSPQDRLKQSLWRGRRNFYRTFQALSDVSFTVKRGETVGIIGQNGSGKSTLLQIICGTVFPTNGHYHVNGRISALLELGAGFNPEFTGKENIYLNGAILGLSHEEIVEKYASIVEFSGIGDKVEQPVKTYSSGMYVRLAFSIAIASEPDILIVDEALAVGDEMFQRKCFARIRAIQERGGTILFVSHAAATIVEICDRALLLDKGELILSDKPKEVIAQYHRLIFAPAERREAVRGEVLSSCHSAPPFCHPERSEGSHAAGGPLPSAQDDKKKSQGSKEGFHYDPSLKPESTVIYESRGVVIRNPRVETLQGEPVNLLSRQQEYIYCYEAAFTESAEEVRFGMLIKTKSGVELGGAVTAPYGKGIKQVERGTVTQVRFRFTCLLLPGSYFLNCGCVGHIEGEETYLHRIIDACMVKILPEEGETATGIVDFLTNSEIVPSCGNT